MGLLYLEGLLMARVLGCGLASILARVVAPEAQRYDHNEAHACMAKLSYNVLVRRVKINIPFSSSDFFLLIYLPCSHLNFRNQTILQSLDWLLWIANCFTLSSLVAKTSKCKESKSQLPETAPTRMVFTFNHQPVSPSWIPGLEQVTTVYRLAPAPQIYGLKMWLVDLAMESGKYEIITSTISLYQLSSAPNV